MISSMTIGSQVHVPAVGAVHLESTSSSKQHRLGLDSKGDSAVYRPLRRGSELAFFRSLFAVSIVSLAVVYLVLQCSQHISFHPKERVATRSLAGGGFGGGFCLNWPGNAGGWDPPSDEDESQKYNAEAGKAAAGGRHGRRSQQPGWGHRRMPPKWLERIRHVLGMIEHLATTTLALLPLLSPEDAVILGVQVSMLAAVELGTYAYIPLCVQPSRAEAGRAHIELVQTLLNTECTRNAALNMDLESQLYSVIQLHGELLGVPAATETFRNYKATMIAWWRTGYFTATQVVAHMNSLLLEGSQNVLPSERVRDVCNVLEVIFHTRKTQLLASLTMRHWLASCQRKVRAFVVFTPQEYDEGYRGRPPSSVSPSDEVYNAIVAAGGTVFPVELPESDLDNQQSLEKPTPFLDGGSVSAHGPSPVLPHDHSGPPSVPPIVSPPRAFGPLHSASPPLVPPSVPPPPGFGVLHPQSHPSGPRQPTAQVLPQLPYHPHELLQGSHPPGPRHPAPGVQPPLPPSQSGAASNWEALGARPRTGAEAGRRASEEGWGRRQMPSDWVGRIKVLLETMRTTAVACSQVLPSVSPPQGVMLTKLLTMLAALQLSVLSYIPDDLQPIRKAVGDLHCHLIDRLLTAPQTLQAATQMKALEALMSVRELLGIISQPAPPTESIPIAKYQMKIIVHHSSCSYAYHQIIRFLKELLLGHQSPNAPTPLPDVFIKALAGMYEVLKAQLLCDGALRHCAVAAHRGHEGPGLFTENELYEAGKKMKPRLKEVIDGLRQAVIEAGRPPVEVAKAHTSGPGQAHSSSRAASQPTASPLPHPVPQQTRFVRPPAPIPSPPVFQPMASQARTAPEHTQASRFVPGAPTQLPRAPASFAPSLHSQWASPWASSLSGGPQTLPGASSAQPHGGTAGSADGQHHHGSPGSAGGELGLVDLAARLSKMDIPDSEDEEDT